MADGRKDDSGKPRTDLLSGLALLELAKVLGHGADTYGPDNWRLGMNWRRYYGAALRHLMAWEQGIDVDEGSGQLHLACAMASLMFLVESHIRGMGTDDRYKP